MSRSLLHTANTTQASAGLAAVPAAIIFAVLALAVLIANHLLLGEIGVVGFFWLVAAAAVSLFAAPAIAFALLLTGLLFQNTLLALLSGTVENFSTFQVMQGTSFIATVVLGGLAYIMLLRQRHLLATEESKILWAGLVFLAITIFYVGLGVLSVSATSALSYARLYFNGPLLFAAGLWLCWLAPPAVLRALFTLAASLLVLWGVLELLAPYFLYSLFNVDQFQALKYALRPEASAFDSVRDVIETQTRSYLNLSGTFGLELQMLRLKGPGMHAISYGYALAFFALVMVMLRRPLLATACVVFAVLVGAKGPLIMLIVTLGLYAGYVFVNKNTRLLWLALLAFVIFYIVVGLIYGFYTDDYHVIGFMGGVKGFFGNPLGHGIGVGGNLSDQSFASRDFLAFQQFGADYALESALGVLLYQMGIGTVAFIWFYHRVWQTLWRHAVRYQAQAPRLMIAPLAMAVLAVNTIFQEEALSPAGWGLWLLFAGMLFGWTRQQAPGPRPPH